MSSELKEEILRYMRTHPGTAETAEGIANWWLARQRHQDAVEAIEAALDALIEEGRVEKYLLPDQTVVYRGR